MQYIFFNIWILALGENIDSTTYDNLHVNTEELNYII